MCQGHGRRKPHRSPRTAPRRPPPTPRRGTASGGPALLAKLNDEDLENLTDDELDNFTDDQLFIIESRLHAKYGRINRLLTNEELRNMNDEQLTALEEQLREEIEHESKAE